ncbi:MAG TPA: NAD-dependent epimerase/dehydratase family protein [Egibacteraceae bacterium]|nr:NAD-dependent epimerase/dehydratase family protein [Egibacteraceae bacterium]
MRVVVFGATGNVGTSLVDLLRNDPAVAEVVGVARRRPDADIAGVSWRQADIAGDDLRPVVAGADVVVHLAWLLQPSRDQAEQWRTNVVGTRRVLDAIAAEEVPALVYASSVGAYSPAPPGMRVTESWPTDGVATSPYSRQKAYTERQLDALEAAHPRTRVVRLRPGLIIKPAAATQIRRLFAGPFAPTAVLRLFGLPIWPATRGLNLQFVHTDDVADAYRRAVVNDVHGAFNIAAEPIITAEQAARALGAWKVPVPRPLLRGAAALTWHLRLQPADPGWIDLAVNAPLLATDRARDELGWSPRHRADDALAGFIRAVGRGEDAATPPLDADSSGPARTHELATGVGGRST